MDVIKVVLVNSWWHDPLIIALFSSTLTGLIFALVLQLYNRLMEKKDILVSLNSELAGNYRSLREIQKISEVKGLQENDGMIAAIRRDNPLKKDLSDKEVLLDFLKNQPVDQQLSIDCWKKLQSLLAKYSKYYPKYEEIYSILKRIINFSKIKTGELRNVNDAEKAAVNQFGAIRINSEEFIKKYEENFLKK